MEFTKMHGIGNDFIFVDGFKEEMPQDVAAAARNLCDRHFGIGADGLVFLLPSDTADLRMRIINSDGSEAEMCGNAIRCFAKLAYDWGYVKEDTCRVETGAGIMVPRLVKIDEEVIAVTVDMGEPSLERSTVPMLGTEGKVIGEELEVLDKVFNVTALLMGVPHCVIFVDDVDNFELEKYGPELECHPIFPRKINVHFLEVLNNNEIKMRVWERGAGITLACGTGACGSLVASVLNGKTERKAKIHLPGGTLEIEWAENNHVYMTGPAQYAFEGVVLDKSLLG